MEFDCPAATILAATNGSLVFMRKIIIFAALAASLAVSACNTIGGAGKDVSSVGHAVTNTANDAKP